MQNSLCISTIVLLVFGCAAAVHAGPAQQSDAERLRPEWLQFDTDGDGAVAIDEIPEAMRGFYTLSDLDRDGDLSLEEYVGFDRDPGGSGRTPLPENVEVIEALPFAGTEDPRQQLDVYLPKNKSIEGPLPVIAYIHGGAWRMGSRVMARAQVAPHVASGRYAAVAISYRLSWQDSWPAQIHDVKAGIRWIRAHADEHGFDVSRVCVMGSSAGGHLAAEVGTTNGVAAVEGELGPNLGHSSDVQCTVDFFGPTDLTSFRHRKSKTVSEALFALFGGTPDEHPKQAREASPLYNVDPDDPPFMIVHGTLDPLVPYEASVELDAALREAGVPVVFQTIEGGGHGDFFSAEIVSRVRAFLERTFYDPSVDVPHAPIVFGAAGG